MPTPTLAPFEPADLFKLKHIVSAALSPNGEQIAYTISHVEDEKELVTIWLVNIASGESRQLTSGTAVDANILINERIREEVQAGRSPVQALEAGFSKAYATIVDSNLTNLIAMACLYAFGSGPVKGFAITVTIGTIVHLFTATTLVRLMISWWYRSRRPRELPV